MPFCSVYSALQPRSCSSSHPQLARVGNCQYQRGLSCVKAKSRSPLWQGHNFSLCLACLTAVVSVTEPALALAIREEPSNALSLPTWAIHISSVTEWVTGMLLMWTFAEASQRPYWKAMSWAMLPSLGGAMCACTWHFFYNAPELEFLVTLQAFLTVVGNITLWMGAYHIFKKSQPSEAT